MNRILIVEDEEQTRQGIKDYLLRAIDCDIQEAADGRQAWQDIKEKEFDLVILDIKLPRLNGIDILKKAGNENLNLDFLVISGWDSLSIAEQALKLGAKAYLPKPFSMEMFGLKVKDILTAKNKYFPR